MRTTAAQTIIVLLLFCICAAGAQLPYDDSPAAVEQGLRIFRTKCARCHNLNAQGYTGRDLTQQWKRKLTDAQLATLITQGIPGTAMPPIKLDSTQTAHVVVYLRSLRGPARVDTGDPKKGEALFWGKAECSKCHMVRGRGGRLGPDLTQVGFLRSKSFLIRELRNPSDYVPRGYDPVMLVTNSGERVKGVRKNEDAFSIQIMDENENLRMFEKSDLRDISQLDQSLMPAYDPDRLSEAEYNDLLRYLAGLQ